MDKIIEKVVSLGNLRYEEDFVDRLNFQFTAFLFGLGAVLVTSRQYLTKKAITCWTPAEFRGGWNEYANDYCLIENTYYLPLDDPRMPTKEIREEGEIPYYQWVQFVLAFLAFGFFLPHLIWRSLNWWSGVQVRAVIQAAANLDKADPEKRKEEIGKIAAHLVVSFNRLRTRRRAGGLGIYHRFVQSGWIPTWYIIMKVLFLVNIVLQLIILHVFLGFEWGDFFSLKLGFNTDWKATGLFPRSTMCDFEVRNKGNVQRYSVQCVLTVNMFNEKLFLVFFYWLFVLFFVTLVNLVVWLRKVGSTSSRQQFGSDMLRSGETLTQTVSPAISPVHHEIGEDELKKPLLAHDEDHTNIQMEFTKFNADERVVLDLLASNSSNYACGEIVAAMYKKKCEEKSK